MVQHLVCFARVLNSVRIVGELSGGDGRRIDDGDDAVDGDPRLDLRPIERFYQGFGQRQTGRLDNDVFGRLGPVQERFHSGQEIIGHGAADTTVGQLHDVFVFATLDAATGDQFTVDAKIAKLINHQRNSLAASIF